MIRIAIVKIELLNDKKSMILKKSKLYRVYSISSQKIVDYFFTNICFPIIYKIEQTTFKLVLEALASFGCWQNKYILLPAPAVVIILTLADNQDKICFFFR